MAKLPKCGIWGKERNISLNTPDLQKNHFILTFKFIVSHFPSPLFSVLHSLLTQSLLIYFKYSSVISSNVTALYLFSIYFPGNILAVSLAHGVLWRFNHTENQV